MEMKHTPERAVKKRYKNKLAQKTFENAIKWRHPIDINNGIFGSGKFAWNLGYSGKQISKRFARMSASYILYYSGKYVKNIKTKTNE